MKNVIATLLLLAIACAAIGGWWYFSQPSEAKRNKPLNADKEI